MLEISKFTAVSNKEHVIKFMVQQKMRIICAFCSGYGHRSGRCTTKREMDRFFRGADMKMAWGTVKGKALKKDIDAAMLLKRRCIDLKLDAVMNSVKKKRLNFGGDGKRTVPKTPQESMQSESPNQ